MIIVIRVTVALLTSCLVELNHSLAGDGQRMFLRFVKSHPLNILLRYPRLDAPNMHRMITIDTSPPQARWMKDTLDRSVFHKTVPVLAARVPAAKIGSVLKAEAMRGSVSVGIPD